MDELIQQRVDERRREWERESFEEVKRRNALWAHVCPLCAGDLKERQFLSLISGSARFVCTKCKAKHVIHFGSIL